MPTVLRNVVYAVAILTLAILARAPLAHAGFLGGDLPHIAAARHVSPDSAARTEALGWLEGGAVRPVAGALLIAHERANANGSVWSLEHAFSWRAIAFLLVLAGAAAFGFALRRALLPWVGGETSRAAGWALALFIAVHPLGVAANARPAAIGDLAAIVFSGAAIALFLLGRQERKKRAIFVAGLFAIAAGFSSAIAATLPFVLAGLEFGSGRRGRGLAERARTSATTFLVFAGCVMLESVFAAVLRCPARIGFAGALPDLPSVAELGLALELCVEKLGVLFFPVPGRGVGDLSLVPAYIGCCALLLVALTPVLRAARAAPRLWGWLALAWLVALAIALAPHAAVRVEPADYSRAELLFPAAVFLCAGLAVAATALSGTRRVWIPLCIALGFTWIGNTGSRAYARAAREVALVRTDVLAAFAEGETSAHVIVIDPPTRAGGLELGLSTLGDLIDPVLDASVDADRATRGPTENDRAKRDVHSIERAALSMLARQPEFDVWRREGLAIVAAPGVLHEVLEGNSDVSSVPPNAPNKTAREVTRLPATAGSAPPIEWRGKGRSEIFDVDPASVHFARVFALPEASTAEAPRLGWRTSETGSENSSITGAWIVGDAGPIAVFDLARSHEWWSAKTVRRVWTEDPLVFVATAALVAEIPLALNGESPRVIGDDWRFELSAAALPRPVRGEVHCALELLDLDTLAYAEFALERADDGDLVHFIARAAERFAQRVRAAPQRLAWSLEARVGTAALARAAGRR